MTLNDPNNTVLTRVLLLATGYTPAAGDVVQRQQPGDVGPAEPAERDREFLMREGCK